MSGSFLTAALAGFVGRQELNHPRKGGRVCDRPGPCAACHAHLIF